MSVNQSLCKDCVNWIELQEGKAFCDYDYWEETSVDDAIIYCAEIFECAHFEDKRKLKDK